VESAQPGQPTEADELQQMMKSSLASSSVAYLGIIQRGEGGIESGARSPKWGSGAKPSRGFGDKVPRSWSVL